MMAIAYNPLLSSKNDLCFYFDALNPKCYSGTGTTFSDLINKGSATASITSPATIGMDSGHLKFTPGEVSRAAYIPFSSSAVTVPTGQTGTWIWFQYWQDQGNIDHPVLGKEAGSSWDGVNGFVFGTGWGTDGPRWGIGGTAYYPVGSTAFAANAWQCWAVTYNGTGGNRANGLNTYVNGVLVDSRTAVANAIGSNSNTLNLGATNTRGGNWGGYLDAVLMWTRELDASEVLQVYNTFKGRYV